MALLTSAMICCRTLADVIKDVYDEPVIGEIDIADVRKMLDEISYEKTKIVVNGNDLVKKTELINLEPISDPLREPYFGTKYQVYRRPELDEIRQRFDDNEWNDAIAMFRPPPKNRFIPDVPEGIAILAKEEWKKNGEPEEIKLS